ncbi:MAG: hypothetical protein ACUVV6_03400, partial [Thermoplasmatota archaeon]
APESPGPPAPQPAEAPAAQTGAEEGGAGEAPEREPGPGGPRWLSESEAAAGEAPEPEPTGGEAAAPPGAGVEERPAGGIHLDLTPPVAGPPPVDYDTVLHAINAMRPMLPLELQYLSPEELASIVVAGREMSPQREPIVMIMGKWYHADERCSEFLQRYRW